MACQHAVGVFSAQRVAGAFQMADAFQQDVVAGALVNGQIDVDFRDGDVAKALPHVDQVHIAGAGVLGFSGGIAVQRAAQLFIVTAGGLFGGVQLFGVHAFYGIIVILDGRTGVALGHHVADDRVGRHTDARQDHQRRKAQFQSGGGIHGKVLSRRSKMLRYSEEIL